MYIIDKNKDYYDYFSNIYGVDKGIIFDRRGSVVLDDSLITGMLSAPRLHSPILFILLEIGNVQHIIKLHNFTFGSVPNMPLPGITSSTMQLVRTFKDHKHYFNSPISIREVNISYHWDYGEPRVYQLDRSYEEVIARVDSKSIDLPILGGTQITSLLDAKEVWIELQTYFSSLKNDKDIDLHLTDVEKAVNHGFDKKTSFRNPIK